MADIKFWIGLTKGLTFYAIHALSDVYMWLTNTFVAFLESINLNLLSLSSKLFRILNFQNYYNIYQITSSLYGDIIVLMTLY